MPTEADRLHVGTWVSAARRLMPRRGGGSSGPQNALVVRGQAGVPMPSCRAHNQARAAGERRHPHCRACRDPSRGPAVRRHGRCARRPSSRRPDSDWQSHSGRPSKLARAPQPSGARSAHSRTSVTCALNLAPRLAWTADDLSLSERSREGHSRANLPHRIGDGVLRPPVIVAGADCVARHDAWEGRSASGSGASLGDIRALRPERSGAVVGAGRSTPATRCPSRLVVGGCRPRSPASGRQSGRRFAPAEPVTLAFGRDGGGPTRPGGAGLRGALPFVAEPRRHVERPSAFSLALLFARPRP